MKIALLGNGKTGSFVEQLCVENKPTVFNSSHPITSEKLKGHDVAISFLPGSGFNDSIDALVASRVPVVSGSTGDIDFHALDLRLKKESLTWVHANNFSLSMVAIKSALAALGRLSQLDGFEFSMSEVHHALKKDSPSGTAKSWMEWLNVGPLDVDSVREGDVVGIHKVQVHSKFESIELSHEARDRRLFAQGALWGAKRIVANTNLTPGLHSFQNWVADELRLNGEKTI